MWMYSFVGHQWNVANSFLNQTFKGNIPKSGAQQTRTFTQIRGRIKCHWGDKIIKKLFEAKMYNILFKAINTEDELYDILYFFVCLNVKFNWYMKK